MRSIQNQKTLFNSKFSPSVLGFALYKNKNIRKARTSISLLITLFLLTGCGSQRFDCPYKEGVRCLRLSEVDKRISSGQLGSERIPKFKPLKILNPDTLPSSPLRTSEEVLTVWIAPYQTEDGTYHEEKRLHFVARPPTWSHTPLEIEEQDETQSELSK